MGFENVDIYVTDKDGDPIPGVVVRVYNVEGGLFYTQATTNIEGSVGFLLNSQGYQLRFYKLHVALPNPLYIDVIDAPVAPVRNVFDVVGELVVPPSSIDPRLCTAFGYFRRPDGMPAAFVDIHFIAKFNPLLLEGDAVVTERVTTRTDKRGYVEMNLIRFGQYDVLVEGIEDQYRLISVPDSVNISLPALLFPVVERVTFNPAGPWTVVAGGDDLQVVPTSHGSDGNETCFGDVTWSSSDPTVLAVLPSGNVLNLRGISPGIATVQARRSDQSIVRIPNTPIEGVPVAVTVT